MTILYRTYFIVFTITTRRKMKKRNKPRQPKKKNQQQQKKKKTQTPLRCVASGPAWHSQWPRAGRRNGHFLHDRWKDNRSKPRKMRKIHSSAPAQLGATMTTIPFAFCAIAKQTFFLFSLHAIFFFFYRFDFTVHSVSLRCRKFLAIWASRSAHIVNPIEKCTRRGFCRIVTRDQCKRYLFIPTIAIDR